MNLGILALVLVPTAGVALTTMARGLPRAVIANATAAAATSTSLMVTATIVRDRAPSTTTLVGPLDLEVVLVVDGLAGSMLTMTGVVALAVAVFALIEDVRQPARRHGAYWPLLFALWGGLNVLFVASDLLTAYLMLELIAVCGSLLVTLRGDRGSVLAGTRYFYAELAASTTTLAGIALLWSRTGTVAFDGLGAQLVGDPIGQVGLAVITAGLLVKLPLAPMHFWLPAAHTQAPSAVSPLLSGVMVKAAFAVLARLWFLSVGELVTTSAAQLIGVLGAVAIVWGSLAALSAVQLKRLIAASTVAQLGLLFLMVPLVAGGGVDAWTGGIVLAVTHALAKAAMLMAAVVIIDGAREDRTSHGVMSWPEVDELQGSAARRPIAVMAFGIAGLSLVGLPPSGGFIAKWYLLTASVQTGQWWWAAVIVGGTLLTVTYLMRFIKVAFAPPPVLASGLLPPAVRDARDLIALGLASTTVVIGLRPSLLLDVIEVLRPGGGG